MSDSNDPRDSGTDNDSTVSNRPLVKPYQDEKQLRELYHEEDLTQSEIAEELDTNQQQISYWMDKFGIETGPDAAELAREKERKPIYSSTQDGRVAYYEETDNGPQYLVSRHQLVALLWYDPEDVFDEETHIHHLIGAKVGIDVPENLLPLNQRVHLHSHGKDEANLPPVLVLGHIFREFGILDDEHSPNAEVTQQGAAD